MPLGGIDEWDRPGGPFRDPEGLGAFAEEIRSSLAGTVQLVELDAHINDTIFAETALEIFDRWRDAG